MAALIHWYFRPPLCMAVSWSYPRHLVSFCEKNPFIFLFFCIFFLSRLFFFCVFFLLPLFYMCLFFDMTSFYQLFYGANRTDLDRLSSCASHSDSLISLSNSMAFFSTNSFGLCLKELRSTECFKIGTCIWSLHKRMITET